jgi:hypothetical protein
VDDTIICVDDSQMNGKGGFFTDPAGKSTSLIMIFDGATGVIKMRAHVKGLSVCCSLILFGCFDVGRSLSGVCVLGRRSA